MSIRKMNGPWIDPFGTPILSVLDVTNILFQLTMYCIIDHEGNFVVKSLSTELTEQCCYFARKISWFTQSNAG